MVVKKLLIVVLCMLTTGLYAMSDADDDDASPLVQQPSSDYVELKEPNDLVKSPDKVQPHEGSFFSALGVVKSEVIAATLMLSNTFGRVALASFLGYKGYKTAAKIIKSEEGRSKNALRALCYFGTATMLFSDGYQWVLRQGVEV